MRGLGSFKRLIVIGFSIVTVAFETAIYSWFWLTDLSIQIRPQLWFTAKGAESETELYKMETFFSNPYSSVSKMRQECK